jgi:DNA transposition AAA+ family ATPase
VKTLFVKSVGNVKRLCDAYKALRENRMDIGMGLVMGEKGLGKTRTNIWYAAQDPERVIYARALSEWTPRWMISDIITELGWVPARGIESMFKQLVGILLERKDTLILVDEVDLVARKYSVMQTLKDIFDKTEVPIVLVGLPEMELALKNYGPLLDRMTQMVRFRKLSLEDVAAAVQEMSELPYTDDGIAALYGIMEPRMRALSRAVLAIEKLARTNNWREISTDCIRAWQKKARREPTAPRVASPKAEAA